MRRVSSYPEAPAANYSLSPATCSKIKPPKIKPHWSAVHTSAWCDTHIFRLTKDFSTNAYEISCSFGHIFCSATVLLVFGRVVHVIYFPDGHLLFETCRSLGSLYGGLPRSLHAGSKWPHTWHISGGFAPAPAVCPCTLCRSDMSNCFSCSSCAGSAHRVIPLRLKLLHLSLQNTSNTS